MDALDKSLLKILNSKSPATVAIFSRNDCCRCYQSDAILVAQEVFLSDVGLRKFYLGNEEITYIIMNSAQYVRVIREVLLRLRYRVEVYDGQDSQYVLKSKGVLGNLGDFEELVADSMDLSELSTIMCVRLDGDDASDKASRENACDNNMFFQNRLMASFCNGQDMKITVTEFDDTPHFSLLEQCIVSLTPRECLLVAADTQRCPNRWKRLETALNRSGVQRTIVKQCCEDGLQCKAVVVPLFTDEHAEANLPNLQWTGLKILADNMQLLEDERYQKSFTLVNFASAGYMHLDMAALKALEVFDNNYDADASTSDSTLHDFLNKCRSGPGRRLLREWLRRPLCDIRQIEERLNVVEALVSDHETRQTLHDDLLRRVPDATVLTRKLTAGRGTLQDCYRLYQLIRLLRRFESVLLGLCAIDERLAPSVKELLVEPVQLSILEFERFVVLVESSIDVEHAESTGQFRIKPSVDEDLLEISKQIDQLDTRANKILSKVSSRLDTDGIKLDSNAEWGFYFRVTLKNEKNIREAKGVKVLASSKGSGFQFYTTELEGLNGEYKELLQTYESSQAHLTKLVVNTCAGYVPALLNLSQKIGVLDVLTTFAVVATSSAGTYVRPEILPKGTGVLHLVQCRHPVVERSSDVQYIPNDVKLGKKKNVKL